MLPVLRSLIIAARANASSFRMSVTKRAPASTPASATITATAFKYAAMVPPFESRFPPVFHLCDVPFPRHTRREHDREVLIAALRADRHVARGIAIDGPAVASERVAIVRSQL